MDVSPSGAGVVLIDQTAPSSYPSTSTFEDGAYVNVEAVPATGYLFSNWSGDLSGTTSPTTILIDCNKRICANFSPTMTLTMEVSGSGSTTPTAGTHGYSEGTVVSITAAPANGWQFDSWTGDVFDASLAATTVSIDSDKLVTANFSVSRLLVGGVISSVLLIGLPIIILIIRCRVY